MIRPLVPYGLAYPSREAEFRRNAFTLMELMIALGLLGALMAVAWSLLGTFRDAEIRGWKLAHRTQTIRSARTWLEDDLQHLSLAIGPAGSNQIASPNAQKGTIAPQFMGNELGFSATIVPSIDPIPFLENLMSDSVQPERDPMLAESPLGQELSLDATPNSPWPAEAVEIEYHLTPVPSDSGTSTGSLDGSSDQIQFTLTRRESINGNTSSVAVSPSERVLTAQDLYRQADDEILSSSQTIRESRLEGLMKAQFRYYDGSSWKSEWNSIQQGGLPRAIAFGFDFPAVSDMQPPSQARAPLNDQQGSSTETFLASDLPFASSGLSSETTSEIAGASDQRLMESSTNEVQIVICVGKGSALGKAVAKQPIQRDLP